MHHLPSLNIGSLSLAINLQDVRALRFILAGEFSYDPCSQVNHHAFWGWSNPPGVCVCVCAAMVRQQPTVRAHLYHVWLCALYRAPRTRDARPHGAPPRPLAAQLWWDRGVGWVGIGWDGLGLWSQCGDRWSQLFCWWFCWLIPISDWQRRPWNDRKIWDGH